MYRITYRTYNPTTQQESGRKFFTVNQDVTKFAALRAFLRIIRPTTIANPFYFIEEMRHEVDVDPYSFQFRLEQYMDALLGD